MAKSERANEQASTEAERRPCTRKAKECNRTQASVEINELCGDVKMNARESIKLNASIEKQKMSRLKWVSESNTKEEVSH